MSDMNELLAADTGFVLSGILGVILLVFGLALLILALLMPYFVWKIKESVERSEELIKQATTQMGFLPMIESQLRNNIAPHVISAEQNIRSDYQNKYGSQEEGDVYSDLPVIAERAE
jgi:uncharacterized membrane protein YciS (DUF1049 family)